MSSMQPYQVGVDGPWADAEAAHLFRRAAFGATPSQRAQAVAGGTQQDLEAAVDALVNFLPEDPWLDAPAGSTPGNIGDPIADIPEDAPHARIRTLEGAVAVLEHWLYRMRYTSQPLQEQLTLLLHDHMPSSVEKIVNTLPNAINEGNDGSRPLRQPCSGGTLTPDTFNTLNMSLDLLVQQNYLYRTKGAGSLRDLVIDVARDPGMLLYLDNALNLAGRPQENFAREVMELFTMGEGNYSEKDIQEIAKCLTGETLPYLTCEDDWQPIYEFAPDYHEPGNKLVFGQTIFYDDAGGETIQVIDLILNKVSLNPPAAPLPPPYNDLPAAAVYMSWKLLTWFVAHDIKLLPEPDPLVLELANYMRGSDGAPYPARQYPYDMRASLRRLFLSQAFFDPANRFAMYKNPADYMTSALRLLEIDDFFGNGLFTPVYSLVEMGMQLFNPPTVAGWDHGKAWMNSGTVFARNNYANKIAHGILVFQAGAPYLDSLLAANGGTIDGFNDHDGMIEHFRSRLIQDALSEEERTTLVSFLEGVEGFGVFQYYEKVRGAAHLMLTMPKFQLK